LFYDDVFNVGPGARGVLSALNEGFAMLGLLVGGALATRLMQQRPGRVITYAGAMAVLAGAAVVGVAIAPVLVVAVAFTCMFMFAVSILAPASQALVSMVIPARARSLGLALALVAIVPGYLIFVLAGAICDHFGLRGGILVLVPVFL